MANMLPMLSPTRVQLCQALLLPLLPSLEPSLLLPFSESKISY